VYVPVRRTVVVLMLAGMVSVAASAQAAPITPSFEFNNNYNYGRFVFGEWGLWYENIIYDPLEVGISIPGSDDVHGELLVTSSSLKSLKTGPSWWDPAHIVSHYEFGPGTLTFTFDYLLNGVREYGALSAELAGFTTTVDETFWNIGSGGGLLRDGVFDARTAELLGARPTPWNGYLQVFFDNERQRLGHLGDLQREAAGYGGPLLVEAPEPGVSALLILGLATLAGVRARRR
jgi:hypothetical protein